MLENFERQSGSAASYWSAIINPALLSFNDYNHFIMYQRSLHVMNNVIQIHHQQIQDMIKQHIASSTGQALKRHIGQTETEEPKTKRLRVHQLNRKVASKRDSPPVEILESGNVSARSEMTTPTSNKCDLIPFRPHSDITTSSFSGKSSRSQRKKSESGNRKKMDPDCLAMSPSSESGELSDEIPSTFINQDCDEEGPISNLFPEVLTTIFSYLDIQSKGRAAQVCASWRDAVYQKSVWKGTEAKLHLRTTNSTLFPSLVRRGIKRVQVLSLRKSLRDLVVGMPNLESLNLSGCFNLSEIAIEYAFKTSMPNLKELNVSLCKDVSDSSINRFVRCCRSLEVLDLGGCNKISNIALYMIAFGLKNIRKLNLRSCRQINDYGIGHLSGHSDPEGHKSRASTIEEICLQDCQKISDKSLKYLSQGLPNLTRVNLSFCVSITDSGLKSLSKSPKLQEINLCSCDNVSDVGIGYLSRAMEFSEHNARTAEFVKLDVSFCNNVSDAGIKHIASGLTHLKELSVANCSMSDESLSRIARSLTHLESLNIGQCYQVTDSSIDQVAKHLTHLQHIDLYGCSNVTDSGIEKLRKLPNMKKITKQLWPDN